MVPLFHEYRLIERSENEINGAWKGAHLLLFFLAFVFGSFCTFCFHMLMYLFEEKCVLFPKLLSLTTLRHNVIYEFIPSSQDLSDMPVDFLSTQWVEKSTCALPTYVPLVSGIFGLVWTTMFLMCSTGSRAQTGLQRPWRVLPPVFVFSLAMGGLCIYSSAITHYGLHELCLKLGEITGSKTCTYTINVATLTYERRIRGVYQATRLTILSAWLHTACWLLSALLALIRVLMAIDFQLVRVNVQLIGDIDKMMERNEEQIRTVSPEGWVNERYVSESDIRIQTVRAHFEDSDEEEPPETIFFSLRRADESEMSLLPEESYRIARLNACKTVSKENQFIVKWLYDLVHNLNVTESRVSLMSTGDIEEEEEGQIGVHRQFGQARISSRTNVRSLHQLLSDKIDVEDEKDLREIKALDDTFDLTEIKSENYYTPVPSTSKAVSAWDQQHESVMNLTSDLRRILQSKSAEVEEDSANEDYAKDKIDKKSNLKTVGVQTESKKTKLRVQISEKSIFKPGTESEHEDDLESERKKDDVDKETQTRQKEKQD